MIDLTTVKPGDMLAVKVLGISSNGIIAETPDGHRDYFIPTEALHPLPTDPHAALRDAVIEAAREWRDSIAIGPGDVLRRAVDALNAAMAPPDPVGELIAYCRLISEDEKHWNLSDMTARIAAVEAMRREG